MELEQWHGLRQLDDQACGLQGLIRVLVLEDKVCNSVEKEQGKGCQLSVRVM